MSSNDYERVETPVLVIGAGAAGLRLAIELAMKHVPCLVVGKRQHGDAHTKWAAGGINAVLGSRDPDDRWAIHAADTIREGHFICQPKAVELLARQAPDRILELQKWGCDFSLTEDGRIDQRYFGAQAFRRTCFAGDRTGEAILQTLVDKAQSLGVPYRQNVYITRLLHAGDRSRIAGAAGFDMQTGRLMVFRAAAVVLAAGGMTSLYQRSTSRPDENTGDAAALAYEAGAALRDMEFVQFHPTGMIRPPDMAGRLVTEAIRGEGGRLYNARGERFMEKVSPERMELEARDVVARAIFNEIQEGRGTPDGGVLLDVSHHDTDFIRQRLPKIHDQFLEQGIDIAKEPMEVAPTAHYAMGGVKVDFETGAATLEGLFALGEASSGLHGANRLGGNSLAETVVFGQITGSCLAEYIRQSTLPALDEPAAEAHLAELKQVSQRAGIGGNESQALIDRLRRLLWQHAGIVRSGGGLQRGLDELAELKEKAAFCSLGLESTMNLRFMLPVAEAILSGALARTESRGAHWRSDAPALDPTWQRNIIHTRGQDGRMLLDTEGIGPIDARVQAALQEHRTIDYHHLE